MICKIGRAAAKRIGPFVDQGISPSNDRKVTETASSGCDRRSQQTLHCEHAASLGANCLGRSLKQGRLAPGRPAVALGLPRRETCLRRLPQTRGQRPALRAWLRAERIAQDGGCSWPLLVLRTTAGLPQPPSALALSPKGVPSAVRSASPCASLDEMRRGAARDRSPGGYARVVGGVGRRSARSMARGG